MTRIYFLWDGENILQESDENHVATAVYTYEPQQYGNLISERRGATSSYYHFDVLGSTRELTNSSGTVIDTFIYNAWGEEIARTGTTQTPFHWIGELFAMSEATLSGLYIRRRRFLPLIGRWLSIDPIGTRAGPNLYSYVSNRPTSATDPSGLWELQCRPLAGVAAATLQRHCWVECDGNTYSLLNKDGEATPVINDPADSVGRTVATGADQCDCIARNFRGESGRYKYDKGDCNSNWFANQLLTCCKITVPRPSGGYGWDNCNRFTFKCC